MTVSTAQLGKSYKSEKTERRVIRNKKEFYLVVMLREGNQLTRLHLLVVRMREIAPRIFMV